MLCVIVSVDFIGGFDSFSAYQSPAKTSHMQLQPVYVYVLLHQPPVNHQRLHPHHTHHPSVNHQWLHPHHTHHPSINQQWLHITHQPPVNHNWLHPHAPSIYQSPTSHHKPHPHFITYTTNIYQLTYIYTTRLIYILTSYFISHFVSIIQCCTPYSVLVQTICLALKCVCFVPKIYCLHNTVYGYMVLSDNQLHVFIPEWVFRLFSQ